MKNYATFLMLTAATSLAACSQNGNGYTAHNGNYHNQAANQQQSEYPTQESQYSARDQENRGYYENDQGQYAQGQHERRGEHGWKDAKAEAKVDHFFQEADTNHDGYVSWKEFQTYMHKKFQEMDTTHTGKLTRDDVLAMKRREMNQIHEEMRSEREDNSNMRSDNYRSDNYNTRSDNSDYNARSNDYSMNTEQ